MRFSHVLLALGVCLAAVGVSAPVYAGHTVTRHASVYGHTTPAGISNHETPWKAAARRSALRRSSEQVTPLLLSPGAKIDGLVDLGNATPVANMSLYQQLDLLPRASRGPPASALLTLLK